MSYHSQMAKQNRARNPFRLDVKFPPMSREPLSAQAEAARAKWQAAQDANTETGRRESDLLDEMFGGDA